MANYLDPYASELQGIQRQQDLAKMLLQQGQQQPQEQMVSGRVAPINPLQAFLPMLNTYQGMNLAKNAESDTKKLADLVRGKQVEETTSILDAIKNNPQEALKIAATGQSPFAQSATSALLQNLFKEETPLIVPEGGKVINRKGDVISEGSPKYHAPIQIDTGTHIQLRDPFTNKVIESIPKLQQPTAGTVVDSANGPILVNPKTGAVTPIMMNGQPLPPKLSAEQTKDIVGINQQKETIQGAINAVKETPSAFSIGRGMAQSLPLGETIAGRFDKPEEAQARAYVFNNVSSVIKERAGSAQSAQELSRINSFLPSKDDSGQQIINKLEGFKKFLADQEKGTRINPNVPTQPTAPKNNAIFNAADEILKGGR
jgi:hypothetical protein